MSSERTYEEINARIKAGKVVVLTAEEALERIRERGLTRTAAEVDVVTTGTFGPMCSSGVFLNFGHPKPRMKMQKVWLNDVPAYAGLAAVDAYLGATELPENDPLNSRYPGEFRYGGAHVIAELAAGRPVRLKAVAYGTDCYPRRELETAITLGDINEAILFNPRNCYQNYNCAVNVSDRTLHTYMGTLKPRLGNANYCSAGQLSPLLKDPQFRTIGVGTRIFLGGGIGYVAWHGTQHFPGTLTAAGGRPLCGAGGTLAALGDLKGMDARWLAGASFRGYGTSLVVGLGIPIPILSEAVLTDAAKPDAELFAPVVDYSEAYPNAVPGNLGTVSYAQLKTGSVTILDRQVPAAPLSSYAKAREIAHTLKDWIQRGEFLLGQPAQLLPGPGAGLRGQALTVKG